MLAIKVALFFCKNMKKYCCRKIKEEKPKRNASLCEKKVQKHLYPGQILAEINKKGGAGMYIIGIETGDAAYIQVKVLCLIDGPLVVEPL